MSWRSMWGLSSSAVASFSARSNRLTGPTGRSSGFLATCMAKRRATYCALMVGLQVPRSEHVHASDEDVVSPRKWCYRQKKCDAKPRVTPHPPTGGPDQAGGSHKDLRRVVMGHFSQECRVGWGRRNNHWHHRTGRHVRFHLVDVHVH